MSDLSEYFLKSKSSVVLFDTLEISHPNFSKTYRVVRNAIGGLTATLETALEVEFEYYPLRITKGEMRDDLNFSLQIDFGDLGEIIPLELDRISEADGFGTKVTVTYRQFRSDDLSAPIEGPHVLEADAFAQSPVTCAFKAQAPQVNLIRTGEVYDVDRFQMLRGFL